MLQRIGKAAYKLELPENSMIHPVFHVSQLKPYTPDFTPVFSELPTLPDLSQKDLQPEAILERRLVKKGNTAIPQVRVKWQGIAEDSSTWEDWYVLTTRFPQVTAWGQADSPGGGGVTPARSTGDTE